METVTGKVYNFMPLPSELIALRCVIWREIAEARRPLVEEQAHYAERAVSMLSDMYLSYTFFVSILVIHFFTVNKHDKIRILLNGSAFTKI